MITSIGEGVIASPAAVAAGATDEETLEDAGEGIEATALLLLGLVRC